MYVWSASTAICSGVVRRRATTMHTSLIARHTSSGAFVQRQGMLSYLYSYPKRSLLSPHCLSAPQG